MKYFSSHFLFFLSLIIFVPILSFPQPLVTIEEIQYQHPDSLQLYGDLPSPYNGQTVKLRGVVMVSPLVNAQSDRRPILWASTRWLTYIQDDNGQVYEAFDGLIIFQEDTTGANQGTFFDLVDTAQVVEFTATINEYFETTRGLLLLTPVTPVQIIQQLPKRPDPIELEISDFYNGSMNVIAEKYEGMYVVIRNVITSDRNTANGTFRINDGQGNYMYMYDQSGYFTLRGHRLTGLTNYQPPADGTLLSYIRGTIQSRFSGTSIGYHIIPLYPGDIKEIQTFQLIVNVINGWNMVSSPGLHPTNHNVETWWPHRTGTVWGFNGVQYVAKTVTTQGEGYWMKNTIAETYNYPAIQIVPHNPIIVTLGWNMIGGYETSLTVVSLKAANPQITGTVWGFNGVQYVAATNLVPGYSYWVKVTAAGSITIPDVLGKSIIGGEVAENFKEDWGRIVITDAEGRSNTLYAVKGEVEPDENELPPIPPAGAFDVRYGSGRIAENINSSLKKINMSGVVYPITVRVEGMDIRLNDETGKMLNINLKDGEDVVVDNSTIKKLMVTGELIPTVYSLEQNYPNPFNPSTVIEFSLPEDIRNVKLSIFNSLGEKVAELVNTALVAGEYSYQWDAKNVATGMYIYELRTDKFVSVKKMVLLK